MTDKQEKYFGTFHNAITNETIVRELTADEIAALPKPNNEFAPVAD